MISFYINFYKVLNLFKAMLPDYLKTKKSITGYYSREKNILFLEKPKTSNLLDVVEVSLEPLTLSEKIAFLIKKVPCAVIHPEKGEGKITKPNIFAKNYRIVPKCPDAINADYC